MKTKIIMAFTIAIVLIAVVALVINQELAKETTSKQEDNSSINTNSSSTSDEQIDSNIDSIENSLKDIDINSDFEDIESF